MALIIRSPIFSNTKRLPPSRRQQTPQASVTPAQSAVVNEPDAAQVARDHAALVAQMRAEVMSQVKGDAESIRELAR